METSALHARFAESALAEALADSPVVLIHGPRQCGKTTLAQSARATKRFTYVSFDDAVNLNAAAADPAGFVSDLPEQVILDEVQRVPAIFMALKRAVDRDRRAGRFLLTGSSNILLIPTMADSLAGRMSILRLHPLAQCELAAHRPRFIDTLFEGSFKRKSSERLGKALLARIVAGGYPAALARKAPVRRAAWYRDYVETLVQRDVRSLARISSLDVLPRLLAMAAGQTAQLFNVSELAAPFQLSRPTIKDYVTLLERVFLLELLPPWHSNRLSRLIKTPKLHIGDSGLACALLGLDSESLTKDRASLGPLLETFVFQELRRQASWRDDDIRFLHFRDKNGVEVDLILERGTQDLAGIEVKASATATSADFRGLKKLRDATGSRFRCGVLLYDGETSVGFGDELFAIPIRALWELK